VVQKKKKKAKGLWGFLRIKWGETWGPKYLINCLVCFGQKKKGLAGLCCRCGGELETHKGDLDN